MRSMLIVSRFHLVRTLRFIKGQDRRRIIEGTHQRHMQAHAANRQLSGLAEKSGSYGAEKKKLDIHMHSRKASPYDRMSRDLKRKQLLRVN